MAYLTKWGGFSMQLPKVSGRLFFVSPGDTYTLFGKTYSASNDHRGEDPDKALRTLAQAMSLVTANNDDAIILLPGAHTVSTTSVAASKARTTIMGLPGGKNNWVRPKTSITTDIAGDEIINVTAADVEIANLRIIPITASDAIDLSAGADNFHLHGCSFDLATPAVSTSTIGITLAAANNILLENFYVECDGAQGDAIVATGALDSVIADFTITQSAGTWASAILCGAATDRLHIDNGKFLPTNATLTAGINGTGATIASGVLVTRCLFADSVTVAIDNFDAGECEIAENYQLGVGATDGGVLITAIT